MTASASVLLVENDEIYGSPLLRAVDRPGVVHVTSVAAARAALASSTFELTVVDLNLPDGSGFDVLEMLPPRPRRPDVLLYTAYAAPDVTVRCRLARVDFVDKAGHAPGSLRDIVQVLQNAIDDARAKRRGTEERKLELARHLAIKGRLTPTESRVLELIASGLRREELVDHGWKIGTLKKHLDAIFNKLAPVFAELDSPLEERSVSELRFRIAEWALYQKVLEG